jgi:hypothetical protein
VPSNVGSVLVALGKILSAETQAALSIGRMKFIRDLIED